MPLEYLTQRKRKVLLDLKHNKYIVIKATDNRNMVCLLQHDDCIAEGLRQFSDTNLYQLVNTKLTEKDRRLVQNVITRMDTDGEIEDSMYLQTMNAKHCTSFISGNPQGDHTSPRQAYCIGKWLPNRKIYPNLWTIFSTLHPHVTYHMWKTPHIFGNSSETQVLSHPTSTWLP